MLPPQLSSKWLLRLTEPHDAIHKLWKLDKVPEVKSLTDDDQQVVRLFENTHSRTEKGRYMVSLPRIQQPPDLGESRARAVRRYINNEKTLKRRASSISLL